MSSRPATRLVLPGKVGYARAAQGPGAPRPTCTAAPGSGSARTRMPNERGAAWLFVVWATSPRDAARQPQEQGRRRHPHAYVRLRAAGGARGREAAVVDAQHAHGRRGTAGLEARARSACGPRSRMWNECNTAIFTQLSTMLSGAESPADAMRIRSRPGWTDRWREGGWPDGHGLRRYAARPSRRAPAARSRAVGFEGG